MIICCKKSCSIPALRNQVANIRTELKNLLEIIEHKDSEGMKKYLTRIREKIK